MTNTQDYNREEIVEFIAALQVLWRRRRFIFAIICLSMLAGSVAALIVKPQFVSKVVVDIHTEPPFQGRGKVFIDLEKIFNSRDNFKSWKTQNKTSPLVFEAINGSTTVENVTYSIKESKKLVAFVYDGGFSGEILIRTNNAQLLGDLISYLEYCFESLQARYLGLVSDVRQKLSGSLDSITLEDKKKNSDITNLVAIYLFINEIERGGAVLSAQAPTLPTRVNVARYQIILILMAIGAVIAAFLALMNDTFEKYGLSAGNNGR